MQSITIIRGVTEDDVRASVSSLARNNSERINPRMRGSQACSYSTWTPTGEHEACLVGQWLIDLGVVGEGELAECSESADMLVTSLVTETGELRIEVTAEGRALLRKCQAYVDGIDRGGVRQPWGNLLEDIGSSPLFAEVVGPILVDERQR